MMMSSTSMTSTSGVTLMSDLTPPLAPPTSIAMAITPLRSRPGACGVGLGARHVLLATPQVPRLQPRASSGLLNKVVHQLRRRVVHLDVEVLETAGEVVVHPHRRDGHDEAERRLDERLGNTGRDRA